MSTCTAAPPAYVSAVDDPTMPSKMWKNLWIRCTKATKQRGRHYSIYLFIYSRAWLMW